ncbi:MAG: hypothetical protein N838_02810 [Thiohalocapsa sp. PB-PSB1]|nr:MAG: hypothetical protein N838_02810 [Thiohalocapsa sp. PB-PSB1]
MRQNALHVLAAGVQNRTLPVIAFELEASRLRLTI